MSRRDTAQIDNQASIGNLTLTHNPPTQFVYPFSLEKHVLAQHPSPHDAITQRRARNAALLHQREAQEEQRE